MKNLLELRNLAKEQLKGTYFESFVKFIIELIKPTSGNLLINKEDNALTIKVLHKILTKQSNCIDVGCNTGDFLIPILELAPLGHHYAFEPIPRLATRLKKRFPTTEVRQIALSDSEGETTFYYVVNSPALSSLKKESCNEHNPNALTESITVQTQRLDNILAPEFKVNFLKIDVEGVELQVFRGAIRTIKTYKPYIIFEHGKSDIEEGHDSRIYNLLVNECNLQVFELKSWLEGLAPLNQDEFAKSPAWNFLATP